MTARVVSPYTAQHTGSPISMELALTEDSEVRVALARNPHLLDNAEDEVIRALAQDPEEDVRVAFATSQTFTSRWAEIVMLLALDPSPRVRRALAANHSVLYFGDAIETLAQTGGGAIQGLALLNLTEYPLVAKRIVQNGSPDTRGLFIHNTLRLMSHFPREDRAVWEEILATLVQDHRLISLDRVDISFKRDWARFLEHLGVDTYSFRSNPYSLEEVGVSVAVSAATTRLAMSNLGFQELFMSGATWREMLIYAMLSKCRAGGFMPSFERCLNTNEALVERVFLNAPINLCSENPFIDCLKEPLDMQAVNSLIEQARKGTYEPGPMRVLETLFDYAPWFGWNLLKEDSPDRARLIEAFGGLGFVETKLNAWWGDVAQAYNSHNRSIYAVQVGTRHRMLIFATSKEELLFILRYAIINGMHRGMRGIIDTFLSMELDWPWGESRYMPRPAARETKAKGYWSIVSRGDETYILVKGTKVERFTLTKNEVEMESRVHLLDGWSESSADKVDRMLEDYMVRKEKERERIVEILEGAT